MKMGGGGVYLMSFKLAQFTKHGVLFSSAVDCAGDGEGQTRCGRYDFEDAVFTVRRGDYAPLMEKVTKNLEKAKVSRQSLNVLSLNFPPLLKVHFHEWVESYTVSWYPPFIYMSNSF